jgi:hypothetical protein
MDPIVSQMHLHSPKSIEQSVRDYVVASFDLLLSDQRKMVSTINLIPRYHFNTILSAVWTFFADGLSKDEGVDSIRVCKHCHRFFSPKRNTRVYCSDSCRVMDSRTRPRQKGKLIKENLPRTRTMEIKECLKD